MSLSIMHSAYQENEGQYFYKRWSDETDMVCYYSLHLSWSWHLPYTRDQVSHSSELVGNELVVEADTHSSAWRVPNFLGPPPQLRVLHLCDTSKYIWGHPSRHWRRGLRSLHYYAVYLNSESEKTTELQSPPYCTFNRAPWRPLKVIFFI